MGRVVSYYAASCLGPSFNLSELSWGELSLVRVVRNSRMRMGFEDHCGIVSAVDLGGPW